MLNGFPETFFPSAGHNGAIDHLFEEARTHLTHDMAGRIVTQGFSYLSRVGRNSSMRLWQPSSDAQKKAPERLDWVSVKQVEILQESGDHATESLEIESGLWSIREMMTMRAGGLRLVIMTAGYANPPKTINDQKKFDGLLETRLRTLDHMQWFDEAGQEASKHVQRSGLNLEERLPHVFTGLNTAHLFGHAEKLDCANIAKFLEQVTDIPVSQNVNHTVMMGLKSPRSDCFNRRQFNRSSDCMQTPFFEALRSTYAHFGLSVHSQMRGYGDHTRGIQPLSLQPRSALTPGYH